MDTSTVGRKAEACYAAVGAHPLCCRGQQLWWNGVVEEQYPMGPDPAGSRVAPALTLGTSMGLWAQLNRAQAQARQGILELEPSSAVALLGQKVMKERPP